MFTLPSMWNLIISTIVFAIVAKYIHGHLDKKGIPNGTKRGLIVLALASLVSWGAGEAADWADETLEGTKPAAQTSTDIIQTSKAADQSKTQD